MKKYIFVTALLCFSGIAGACDICGCSSGSLFTGPFHFTGKHFTGIRYAARNYFSRMADDPAEFSKDHYQAVELWGGITIKKRWQLLAFIPYNKNLQQMEAHPHSEQGLGDITLLANYQLVKQLWLGGGLKIPTGKFAPGLAHHPVPSANIQPGTGSVDFIANATHIISLNKWSLHNNINYKLNGSCQQFHFGDRLNISSVITQRFSLFAPFAGLQYEKLNRNKLTRQIIPYTGGRALLGTMGLNIFFKKINIGADLQVPLAQNFSNHQTVAKWRGMVQLNYVF